MQLSQSKKFLLLSLLATSSLSVAFAQQTTPPVNLALKKSFVSSDPNMSGWNKGLTDGSWRSAQGPTFATGNSATFPKDVTIDLETPVSVGYVAVGVPGFGSTKTIDVSLSEDGTTFTGVGTYTFSVNKEEKHLFSFPAATARFVRLTYVDHSDEKVSYPVTHAFTTEVAVYAPGDAPVLTPVLGLEKADVASPKYGDEDKIQAGFLAQHESFLKRGTAGPIGVLFLGDSITAGWGRAKDVWQQHFGAYDPANFGIGGDKTQHVLWRIDNGELDGIAPKVVVLMIGTNNIGSSAEEIIRGDTKIVDEIHQKLPNTKLLLLGIFPRAAEATNPMRAKIKEVNTELAKLDDGNKTRYLDIGDKFLETDGSLSKDIMPDYLHPNPKGYQIWADAIQPLLDEMMK
ncbi:hypothetical protein IAD21_02531 [Abditibacteriota bacterium]|nr:hypothetical protein IAD21_02531 [Abditibacteriota bacterium]